MANVDKAVKKSVKGGEHRPGIVTGVDVQLSSSDDQYAAFAPNALLACGVGSACMPWLSF
jgi:hypothetical protein